MRHAASAVGVALTIAGHAPAKAHRPAPPLPMLSRVSRVRVEAAHDRVIVLEDVTLPRGDWLSGGLDVYVAFGAPGTPLAIDARLLPAGTGSAEPRAEDSGDPVVIEPEIQRTRATQPLLGSPFMAGVALHVKEAQLRRDYESGEWAVLRIRTLMTAPTPDRVGGRDVVVRLGIVTGLPLTLGRIQVVSLEAGLEITRAQAKLCGPDADSWPLAVSVLASAAGSAIPSPAPAIAPTMAVRHPSDDLCVRWWTRGTHKG